MRPRCFDCCCKADEEDGGGGCGRGPLISVEVIDEA